MGRVEELLTHQELRADGWDPHGIAREVRAGRLRRVRWGVYQRVGAMPPTTGDRFQQQRAQHLLLIRSTMPLQAPVALSHQSAAILHDLPHLTGDLRRIHVTRPPRTGGGRRGLVHLYTADLPEGHVVLHHDLPVTDLARTVVDLARHLDHDSAVAVGDAALHRGLEAEELETTVAECAGWPGVRRARRVVRDLDGRSESVGESISRMLFKRHHIPAPVLQHPIELADGRVARVDFAWPELGTVGEFDGRMKYGLGEVSEEEAEQILWQEKLREDSIRDLDLQVVRWVNQDLGAPASLLARLHRAFDRGRSRTTAA